jgi:hypothetical protein
MTQQEIVTKAENYRKIILKEKKRLETCGRYHFDERTHIYTMDDTIVPSVTKIISTIPPDLLMNSNFIRKTKIGTDTHCLAEFYTAKQMGWKGIKYPDLTDIEIIDAQPYINGYMLFLREVQYYFIACELRVHSHRHGFAGTLDILALNSKGQLCILDIKTVSKLSPTVALQLAGYGYLFTETYGHLIPEKVKHRAAIWLTGNSKYQIVPYTDKTDESVLLCKAVSYQWDKKHGVK